MTVMAKNKVVYMGVTLIDLTDADASAGDVVAGKYFYGANGELTEGSIADGNEIGYGLTDGTLPLVGVAKVGYAEI